MQQESKEIPWEDSNFEFNTNVTTKFRWQMTAPAKFQSNTIKVKADANGKDMYSNNCMKVAECAVMKRYGHYLITSDFKADMLSNMPNEKQMVISAIHDIGIPEPCTDIMNLLIDDLLTQPWDKQMDRYYRVWSSSGEAILVSSTTLRRFNAEGYLYEVGQIPFPL